MAQRLHSYFHRDFVFPSSSQGLLWSWRHDL